MSAAPGRVPPMRSAGLWTMVLGTVHVASVHVFYPESVRSIMDGGVVASVEAEPTLIERRGVGFWYVTSGLMLIGSGAIVRGHENEHGRPPAATAPVLVATGLWGALLVPVSPFWLFLPIAWPARSSARPSMTMTSGGSRSGGV